jgi:hypothetical protein
VWPYGNTYYSMFAFENPVYLAISKLF